MHVPSRVATMRFGDVACELDALARAARAGADLEPASERLRALARAETSKDGEIARLEACVALARSEGRPDLATSYARELGAALWSWAGDRAKALDVWLSAVRANGSSGPRVLRVDLTTFGGAREAEVQLAELVEREGDPERAGLFAVEAARAAMESGAFPRALNHARVAISKCSGHAEALEVAESASVRAGRPREMETLYDLVAQGARGRFGRRAAHHRAARFFEAQGLPMFALKHAAQAFIAVPSEGTTLALLERTAEKANRRAVAARTVEHVADLARSPELRAAWLERAVELAAADADGLRQRFELLLKAAVLRPSPGLVDRLAAATRALLTAVPDDVETMALRLEHASDELSKKLEGPDGARIGIAFAELALDPFTHGRWAWQSLHRAFDADADVDEYARLLPQADRLAADPSAREETSRWLAAAERPYANVGSALFRLAASIARRLDDAPMIARALVAAVEKEPDDDQLVADADEAVASVGSEELAARLAKKVGPRRTSLPAAEPKPASVAPVAATSVEPAPVTPVAEPAPVTPVTPAAELAPATLEELRRAAAAQPTFERWLRVERAADAADDDAVRVEALQNLSLLAPADEKLEVLKRLARAEGARGELASAELHWREVVERRPFDPDADVALEALFVARSSFTELSEHLGRRLERLGEDDETSATRRALRLRRAAIYEQRLLKLEEAAAELERLLIEFPGNESALRWLADLNERLGWHRDTLRVLDELLRRPMDPQEREALQIRRTKAMLALGDGDGARTTVAQIARHPFDPTAVLELRVEVGRVLDDPEDLGAALVELGRISSKDASARSEMFIEAAQVAARLGDDRVARERAAEGARLAPHAASVQLFACGLEYRARRAGTVDEARATIDVLSRFQREGTIAAEDVPLAAFLLAEAEDVVTPGRGERTLRECLVRTGPHPLLALGLAERAAAAGRPREALVGYAEALSGNLLGLRSEGAIALSAAELADPAHDADLIERLLERAEADPATAGAAQARRSSLRPPAQTAKPPIVTPVRTVAVASPKATLPTGPIVPESAIVLPAVASPPPDRSTPRAMVEAGPPEELNAETPIAFTPVGELREAYASLYRGDSVTAEQLLFDALRGGSLEAADALDALLSKDRTRGAELLAVRRRAVEIQPGNMKRLARLREAARLDQNAQLFRAIDHVMAPFEPGREPVPPPPLTAQSAQPGMLMLLSRHSLEPTGEALGIVWEHAQGLFVRSLSATGTTGLERVVPGPMSPLSRLYEVTLRLLDTPKFALFHRRSSESEGVSVLLLTPPSAVLTSDAREDTPLVRWHMGEALSGALPENALLFGSGEAEARSLLEVLSVAFGSAGLSLDRAQAQLAESLWQTLPARAQRRLRELFATETPYELAMERAKQSGRRIGMFLSGDFSFSARRVLDEFPSIDARAWDADGGLEQLCAEVPALSDLFRLAVTPEYADARWRKPAPTPHPSGRTSLV